MKRAPSRSSRNGPENRPARERRATALREAMLRRIGLRATLNAKLTVPAVPGLVEHYVELVARALLALGRPLNATRREILVASIREAVAESWRVSPHGSIVLRIEADGSGHGTFGADVVPSPSSLEQQYDLWIATREPPFFGTFPDARLMHLLATLGPPASLRVLDVGAGTGRNTLALAQEGCQVSFIEPTEAFARDVLAGAADGDLPIDRLSIDFLAPGPPLVGVYDVLLLSEVTSHFRSRADLERLFSRATEAVRPGGYLLCNVFLATGGYEPDDLVREIAQSAWSTVFTRDDLRAASAGAPFVLVSDEPVKAYEQAHLPEEGWPPRTWYAEWTTGRDIFDLPEDRSPVEMRWLVYRRDPA